MERVKLVPLKWTWTCPRCRYQNVVTAYDIAVEKLEADGVVGHCKNCNQAVILGVKRKGE